MANENDFRRYLEAKRTVDDRALNRTVIDAFRATLQQAAPQPPRLLEIGSGTGTMLERLIAWTVLNRAHYTLLDEDPGLLRESRDRLAKLASARNLALRNGAEDSMHLIGDGVDITVCTRAIELTDYLGGTAQGERHSYDALIACAVLDLLDLKTVLPGLWSLLKDRGSFWFCIDFDGESIFLPEHELDADIFKLYHRSMDVRIRNGRASGHSRTGRRLLTTLLNGSQQLLAAGSSDWVVHPIGSTYPDDEAYFLHFIVNTISQELDTHPELSKTQFLAWVAERHRQIDAGTLAYIAHQLDFTGRANLPSSTQDTSGASRARI